MKNIVRYILVGFLVCNSLILFGQNEIKKDSTAINPDSIYLDVDKKAEYPGGHKAWSEFMEKKVNGLVAVENGAPNGTYTVVIACIIDESGKIIASAPQTSHGHGMEKEVMRVLSKVPKAFIPAYKNAVAVKSKLNIPMIFSVSSSMSIRF